MLCVPGSAARHPGNPFERRAPSIGQAGSSDVSSTCAMASRSNQLSSATLLCPGAATNRFCMLVLVVRSTQKVELVQNGRDGDQRGETRRRPESVVSGEEAGLYRTTDLTPVAAVRDS